jgi:hypothetical protein
MATTLKTKKPVLSSPDLKIKTHLHKKYPHFWMQAERYRFGIIPVVILLMGCVSGLAVAFGAKGNPFQLALVVVPSVLTLALILAVAPMRLIIYVTAIAIVLDLLTIFV